MKFGTLYSYWGNEWGCDYPETAKKIKEIGFDIIEIGAGHLLEMRDRQLREFRALTKDLDLTVSANIGPAKEYDVASADPEVRRKGISYLCSIMEKMDAVDSRTLVGVTYTYWPNDFSDLDKKSLWGRAVESVKQTGRFADSVGVDICLEVVNRFETLMMNTAEEGVRFCDYLIRQSLQFLKKSFAG